MRIFTGAPLPDGADAIVIQEDTARDGDIVVVRERPPRVGTSAPPASITRGRHRYPGGPPPDGRDIGLAAAMDRPWLMVHRRPRVAILSTGDEIVMPGDPIGPNQIVSSNSLALGAFVAACGAVPLQLGIAADTPGAVQRAAEGARGADLLVTTGGASVGEHDLVKDALGAEGLELDFWKIAMRPGKPLMVGRYRDAAMVGLPGNPVSTLVCALIFLKPALERLSGIDPAAAPPVTARLAIPFRKTTDARIISAPPLRAPPTATRGEALREAGQLHDVAAGPLRLPGRPPAPCAAAKKESASPSFPWVAGCWPSDRPRMLQR